MKETKNKRLLEQKKRLYETFKRSLRISDNVLKAFMKVPREEFVPKRLIEYSYIDEPLPIGEMATISAISMSLMLCEYAELKEGDLVLEVGTGSGYQAALLAEIVCEKNPDGSIREGQSKKVYTIEISSELYEYALSNLKRTCYLKCVDAKCGDGTLGWPDKTIKFDAIIITAAGSKVPEPLLDQLKVKGRLIMPYGGGWIQTLIRIKKIDEGRYEREYLEDVRFVPLRGKYGEQ
ncbi:MAG: protein-L-isoaspartate(D-aspartate) O-methyltransferase [Candidatus Njordarchaeia archaeon]